MNAARARYLLRRLGESPPSFLIEKALLLARRRWEAVPARRAARTGRRLGGGFERCDARLAGLGAELRARLGQRIGDLEARGELPAGEWIEPLCAAFDVGEWDCLGYGRVPLVAGGWQRDALHGASWPLEPFATVDFVRASERSDVKIPWEVSRLQWLLRVAIAEQARPDATRCARALELVQDWIDQNPYGLGIHWVSAMEVAIRGVNLLVAFLLLEDRLGAQARRAWLQTLGEHRRYLMRFPETSDVAGNHYLASRLGSFALSLPLSDGAPSGELLREAARLRDAFGEQFTEEALHVEFAPIYHRLTLDMLAVARALGQAFAPELELDPGDVLGRGEALCRRLAGPAGRLPLFGDADGGMVFDLGQGPRRFAHLTPGDVPREPAEALVGALLLSLAGEGRALPEAGAAQAPAHAPPFVILEHGDDRVVARAGPIGLGGRASHDHEDQLSFWFTSGDLEVVVESGSPPYTRSREERRAGLVSSAHNVVSRAGHCRFEPGQGSVADSVRGGPLGALESLADPPRSAVLRLLPGTGGPTPGCPAEHRRELRLAGGGRLEVVDRFRWERAGRFEARLHLPPGARLPEDPGPRCTAQLEGGACLDIELWAQGPLEVRREEARFHPDYGAVLPSECLVVSGACEDWTELRTTLAVRLGADVARG